MYCSCCIYADISYFIDEFPSHFVMDSLACSISVFHYRSSVAEILQSCTWKSLDLPRVNSMDVVHVRIDLFQVEIPSLRKVR